MTKEELDEIKRDCDKTLRSYYNSHLQSELVQFLILAATKNGGKIKITNLLLSVNGFTLTTKEAIEKHKLDLIFFGSVDEAKSSFILNKTQSIELLDIIDYDKPIVSNLTVLY